MEKLTREEVIAILEEAKQQGKRPNFSYMNLSGLDLSGLDFLRADLTRADLTCAILTCANLTCANLDCVDLTDADLTNSNCYYANFYCANFTRAKCHGADLTCAILTRADLTFAILTRAILTCANLDYVDLTDADLTDADLTDADFTRAKSEGTDLIDDSNLSKAGPFIEVGKAYLFRTVTHIELGKVESVHGDFVKLVKASWIADTGRYHDCLKHGELNEVEPYPDYTVVNLSSLINFAPWNHELPTEQK